MSQVEGDSIRRIWAFRAGWYPNQKGMGISMSKELLVGYTGFVGSNLAASHSFDLLANSTNVKTYYSSAPGLCVYAGVRAEKFLANTSPEADMDNIRTAMENIRNIRPRRLVLISTVDVYQTPVGVDEESVIETGGLHAYGRNRYHLEQWARETYPDCLIVRLPGLYGMNLKKNFIFDLIHVIPSLLGEVKYRELAALSPVIGQAYQRKDNGFYQCRVQESGREELKNAFRQTGFSAVNFTDSRGVFQFYNLRYLWQHVERALELGLRLLNIATEPVAVCDIYRKAVGREFINEVAAVVPYYDYKSRYAELLGGEGGYLFDRERVLEDIGSFIAQQSERNR